MQKIYFKIKNIKIYKKKDPGYGTENTIRIC